MIILNVMKLVYTTSKKKTYQKIRLAFLRTAICSALGFTGNQLTEGAWLFGSSPIFNVRKLTKNSVGIRCFWLKYLVHLENLGEKNASHIEVLCILR